MKNYLSLYKQSPNESCELKRKLNSRDKMALPEVVQSVEAILKNVREQGSQALIEYTFRFDKAELSEAELEVSQAELEEAERFIDAELFEALKEAAANIYRFHKRQKEQAGDLYAAERKGRSLALLQRPLKTVGIYVPGGTSGTTPLPSSVLMNAIPAKAAGVKEIIMCTPPNALGKINPTILLAAQLAGVSRIFKLGGAQAIAAMAYGTGPVPAVDKICGPGNIYVNTAKRLVYGQVDIDMFAGPSEILVIADAQADPRFVARDLLSQAEHDVLASAILLTDDLALAEAVQTEIAHLVPQSARTEILEKSLRDFSAIVLVPNLETAVDLSNSIAPEHLELCVSDEQIDHLLALVEHAGAVFLGYYSPEPLGDYWAGANHVLPTSGSARFFSPLNTGDFMKKMSLIRYSEEALREDGAKIVRLAKTEGLGCHASAVAIRMGEEALS